MNELRLQSECFQWFHNTYPQYRQLLFRVKGELDNHPRKTQIDTMKQLAENKATGIVPGVSDFVLALRKIHFIELKIGKNTQQQNQIDFQRKIEAMGHEYAVLRSLQEFQNYVIRVIQEF